MISHAFQRRIEAAKRAAHGNWPGLLERLGVAGTVVNRRNQPCPGCGGEDRFQFTDKYGDGNYICRGCGAGDGFKLLELCLGWKFSEALKAVEELLGTLGEGPKPPRSEPSVERMRKLAKSIWQEARPIAPDDAVARYLAGRGIVMAHYLAGRGLVMAEYPRVLRMHPALGFYVKSEADKRARRVGDYPAMLAAVQGPDGHAVTIHRTYLANGAKAPVPEPKKLLNAGIAGAAVRLFEPGEELALTEGIETALAVHLRTGKPVWAALSAANLEKVWVPEAVTRVGIYADNDASYTGQAAAYALARRLRHARPPREVAVYVPRQPDTDWADVLLERVACAV